MALKFIFVIIAIALVNGETPSLQKEISVILEPLSDSIIIPDSQIVNGSVGVRKGGLLLDKELWRLTGNPSCVLKFTSVRNSNETLTVSYRVPSLPVGKTVWKRKIELIPESADSAVIMNSGNVNIAAQDESAGLTVGGSKTLGVTVGSGGALAVNQTLDLTVYGEIAKGIEVRARLADQNLPFRSEGSTESIREIDKILIEVRSGKRGLTLGDMVFTENRSRFASYEKKIKGIKGESRGGYYSAEAGVALSDGKFHSYSFQGEEGRQGPYIIVDAEGRSAPVVLSGTERVFINGRLRVRGEGNDYTMDYNAGRLTFTPRCLITADDRIMIEFEYMDTEYQKSIIAASGQAKLLDGRLNFTFSGLRESDDYSNPAAGTLSEEELQNLRNAGDSAAADGRGARIITRDSVAVLRGFYTIETSVAFSDSHFVYHPPKDTAAFRNRVFYDVSFLYTGSGRGGYVSDTVADSTDPGQSGTYAVKKRIFKYAGEGLGDYKPGRRLIAPLQHDIGHAGYSYKDSIFAIKGEFSGSSKDTNRLSALDDTDNGGYAFYNNISIRLAKLTLKIRQEERSTGFRSLSTIDDPYLFSRRWNYRIRNSDPYLSLFEGGASWNASDKFSINAEGGRLKRRLFSAERGEFSLSMVDASGSRALLNAEGIRSNASDTTRDIVRAGADGEKRGGAVIPRVSLYGEYTDEISGSSTNRRTLTAEGKMGARNGKYGMITGESEIAGRIDRKSSAGGSDRWLDSALSVTFVNKGYLDFGREFRADIAFTHRSSKRDDGGTMNTVRSNLITFQGSSELKERAVDQRMMYSLSTEQSQQLVPVYIPVPTGTGTHVKDPLTGDYILREGGNYIYGGQVADTNAALTDALKSLLSYRITFTPGRLPSLKEDRNILKYLSIQSYWNAEQDIPSKADLPGYRKYLPDFDPLRATGSDALQYRLEVREELLLDDTDKRYSVRVRFLPRYRYTFRGEGDRDSWNSIAWSVTGRHLVKESAQFEHTLEQEEVTRSSGRTLTDYNVVTSRIKSTCDVEVNKTVILPFVANGGVSTTSIGEIGRVPFASASVGVILSKPQKGRGEAHYTITNVMYDGFASLPYDAADGEKAGITHKANGSVKVNATKNIDFDMSLFWERNSIEARSWIRGNMELRAYF